MEHDVFISYSSKNKEAAQAICHVLEQNEIRCWMAPRDLHGGAQYGDVIDDAIRTCKVFVVVFSKAAQASPWVNGELNVAFEQNKTIIPFKLEETPLKGQIKVMLNQKHWIDAYPDYKTKFNDLVNAVSQALGHIIVIKEDGTDSNSSILQKLLKHKIIIATSVIIVIAIGIGAYLYRSAIDSRNQTIDDTMHYINTNPLFERNEIGDGSMVFDVDGVKFRMKLVKTDGSLMLGATLDQKDSVREDEGVNGQRKGHRVAVDSYWIGETEVTQALWRAVMGNNPSEFKGDEFPVEKVSWNDCQEFLKKLNGLNLTNKSFSLPTEAEWEIAARSGIHERSWQYSGSDTLYQVAWYKDNSENTIHQVAQLRPNLLGLYDMSGNVWEWCEDYYKSDFYEENEMVSPCNREFPDEKNHRVIRGGSWHNGTEWSCRVAFREYAKEDLRAASLGFRIVMR